jgi:hypothetical protein
MLIATALAAPAAAADPPRKASPPVALSDADQKAAEWLGKGNKAFKEGRFADAESAYREAWALKKGYDVAGDLGAAELAQGKLRAAAEHLALTLRLFPLTGDPAARTQMAQLLDRCRQSIGAVRVKLETPGAQVYVDGEPVGEAPLADEVFVEPGDHTFEAKLDGYSAAPVRVSLLPGASTDVTLALSPAAPAPPAPDAQPRRRSIVPGLGLGAVAAVGIGGGIAFLVMSAGSKSDAQTESAGIVHAGKSCVPGAGNYDTALCGDLSNKAQAYVTYHDVAVGSFIAGGVVVAGTAAYFLWPSRQVPAAARGLRVVPIVGAGDGGVLVSGSF